MFPIPPHFNIMITITTYVFSENHNLSPTSHPSAQDHHHQQQLHMNSSYSAPKSHESAWNNYNYSSFSNSQMHNDSSDPISID